MQIGHRGLILKVLARRHSATIPGMAPCAPRKPDVVTGWLNNQQCSRYVRKSMNERF
jgi:hypothetical protein